MKKTILASILVLSSLLIQAQETPSPRGYLALNIGAGLPMGEYRTSYALPGATANISYALPIKTKGWGLSAQSTFGSNGYDVATFGANFNRASNLKYTNITYGSYTHAALLVGGFYTITKTKLSYDFVMQVGILNSSYPTISFLAADNYGNSATTGIQGASSTTFGFNMGAGMRYSITPKIALCANISYLTGNASYNNVSVTNLYQNTSGNYDVVQQYTNFQQRISLVNITLGVAWQFSKK